ncbi:MAG TPA: hypothetical protein PKV98_04445 [Burkholderiaceae bacterium]|nr:hypothetical protein [Burkholderiaceae bacterium]
MTAIGFVLLVVGLGWIRVTAEPWHAFMPPTGLVWMAQTVMIVVGATLIVAGAAVFLWEHMP